MTSNEDTAISALTGWMLRATPFPTLVVDTDATVRYANALANGVLANGDGVHVAANTLRLEREPDQQQLMKALRGNPAVAADRPPVVLVERSSNKRPYALIIVRAPGHAHASLRIVLINDTGSRINLHPEWVAALFNVTPAEARIVALIAQGMAVEDIGASLKVTAGTVRVHLRNVYRKLNVRRQSDLVATVLGATAVFCSCQPLAPM